MKRIDIMLDLETLGKKNTAPIFQIGAIAFNIETGETLSEFNQLIDIETIKKLIIEPETLKWWLKTDKELLNNLINNKNAMPEITVVENFKNWIYEYLQEYETYIWGNGISFDITKIKELFDKYNLNFQISFRNERDVRTIVDIASQISNKTSFELSSEASSKEETKHDAIDDCKFQIRLIKNCFKIIKDKAIEI